MDSDTLGLRRGQRVCISNGGKWGDDSAAALWTTWSIQDPGVSGPRISLGMD